MRCDGFTIEIWINYDDPARREIPDQYSIGIRPDDTGDFEERCSFSKEDFSEEALKNVSEIFEDQVNIILAEKYIKEKKMTELKYDKTKFFAGLKLIQDYPIGKEYYLLDGSKIKKCSIYKVFFKAHNRCANTNLPIELGVETGIEVHVDNNSLSVSPDRLFESREEVADYFLKQNDVPAKLLQILNPPKPKTTVADLIEKLNSVDPAIDLADMYWPLLKRVEEVLTGQVYRRRTDETNKF